MIRPRLILSSSISTRALSGLLLSELASNTVHRDVHAMSSANSSTMKPNSRAIGRVHGACMASFRARSETSNSNASRTKFATIDEPP